ncbi:helix-turn-helix transcriptional regulator [Phenylobacterium sp. J426]|uniref:helix-turn-helix transcriptional regulator n=1 Tax=Phenylobacterium sp. J426 TaxID=2898439 RepID=UPI002150A014|nr:helix-turn-helix transcriptional regulator [Phenylobacterium sp. J426]MCR5875084.1 helix-turn-helix transcriptional regulator [Phenylobacterium sp. J426]
MIRNDDHWVSVVDAFGDAALGGDWLQALEALGDACGAERGELIGVGADRALPFNWMSRIDMEPINAELTAIGGGHPDVNPRVARGIRDPLLAGWHDAACSTEDELRRNFAYADICRRWDIPYGSQATLLRNDGMLIGLAVLRTERQGRPEAADRQAFEALAPQVRAAVRAQLALEGQGAALIGGTLEAIGAAAFVCDGAGRVCAHTPAAEIALSRGLLRLRGQRLAAARDEDSRALEAGVRRAVSAPEPGTGDPFQTLVLRDPRDPGEIEVVDLVPLPRRPFAFGFQPRAVAVVRGAEGSRGRFPELLRLAFRLTPSEADVAVRLVEGETREAIAIGRGASVETVRSQVRSLLAKVGVRRTGELTAKLGRLR